MKVAFINNMNNNFFSVVRYLRDKGIDAHLFIFDELYHGFFPESDTFDDVSKLTYIHVISQVTFKDFFNPLSFKVFKAIKKLKQELKNFDLIFACGMLAFFERANLAIDVFIPYGGDIYQLTDLFNYSKKKYFPYSIMMKYIMKYQRRAIQRARAIVAFANHDLKIQDAIKNLGRQWINWNLAMVYPIICPDTSQKWLFLQHHDFILFSHIRHTWKTGTDYNGNDRAIKGYAKFIKEKSRFQNPIFVLFEYGCDIDASKKLIIELGIEKYVKWMPAMQRKYIYAGLQYADLVMGIFNDEVISCGGVTYEAFSKGIPVIGCAKVKRSAPTHDLPLVHAFEIDEILGVLVDFQDNPKKYQQISVLSKKWFDKNLGENLIDNYINLINLLIQYKSDRIEDIDTKNMVLNI